MDTVRMLEETRGEAVLKYIGLVIALTPFWAFLYAVATHYCGVWFG